MRRVTADTNIYVSALNFNGPPRRFLRLASDGQIRLALSQAILDEVTDVLKRKFHWPAARIDAVRKTLQSITESITPVVIVDVVKDDPDDNRILECAQSAHSECIVTGDGDLLRLGQYDGMKILTVNEYLRRFASEPIDLD